MLIKRRTFIKTTGLASASILIPNFLKALSLPDSLDKKNKILIVLQFSGGNDGLNTIIPIQNDLYFGQRPQISINKSEALKLSDLGGINPNLSYFKTLYDQGELAILNNVGYPEPNKSHFRSMDIWQTASGSDQFLETGWLGRYLDEVCYDCEHPTQLLEINDLLSLASKGKEKKAIALENPKKLIETTKEKWFNSLSQNHESHHHDMADYLYSTLGNTLSNADYIFQNSQPFLSQNSYPKTKLGKDFETISSLIKSDINTRVYYLSIGSFDTHINQNKRQKKLFNEINEAVNAFVKDMKANHLFENILLMTFSEFGRRVAENASGGTDHGKANQMFFISGGLKKKGILNELPDLSQLDDGDLIYKEDFRKVYSTILKNWLDADDRKILGKSNGYYDFI